MRAIGDSAERDRVTGTTPERLRPRQHAAPDRAELACDPRLADREAGERDHHAGTSREAEQRVGLRGIGEVLRRRLGLTDLLEYDCHRNAYRDTQGQSLDLAVGTDKSVDARLHRDREREGGGADTRDRGTPACLPNEAAHRGLVLTLPDEGHDSEANRDHCHVEEQSRRLCPLEVGPALGEGKHRRHGVAACVDRVLRDDREQEVRAGRETGDHPLVHPRALRQ